MNTTTTRRILKKVASLLGKEEKLSSPIKEDVSSERYGSLTKTTATGDATEFFFARVPPSVTYEELLEVFERYGAVEHLNLFRPFAEAKTSKGCGIVRYSSSTAAAAARAELHDKHKWSSDYAPMVLERVNEKKKRSNISNGGTNELIFTPKFLTKAKDTASTQQQQQRVSRGGMLHGGEVQRHPSQSSSCSTLSVDGPARFYSHGSMGSVGSAASGRDSARMSDMGCGLVANGYMAQFAIDTINSAECNAISSGSLLQPGGATAAGACGRGGAGQVCSGSNLCSGNNLALINSGQLLMAEQACRGSFEQQQQQQQQHQQQQQQQQQQAQHALKMEAAARGACVGQQHTAQVWRQQWQAAGTGLDEACAGAAGGAYLPSFRQLQGSQMLPPDAALSAAVAYAAMQPTSLSILAGPQQEQLGMQLTLGDAKLSCGPSVLPMHGRSTFGGVRNAAAFEGLAMVPAGGPAGDSMGLHSLPSAFANNNECFSTYSNFLDGHPSMQLPTAGTSGHFASLSAAANAVADAAAAADCSASLFTSGNFASGAHASGAMLGCVMQQQRQLQQHAALQSGSNLQLTSGALCQGAAGGLRDGVGDLAEMHKQHLLQLDGDWAGAGDSGYFDLYKSGSSLDSFKGDDATGTSSCSYPNKLSSCSSSETRHTLGSSAATVALARQQQEQLLTVSEQRKLQLAGLPVSQAALQQMVSMGAASNHGGLFARPNGSAAGQHWPLQPPPPPPRQQQSLLPVSGSLFSGADINNSGSLLPLSGSNCKAEEDTITLDVPTTSQGVRAVAVHIESIRSMSGAVMAIVPQPGGQLNFKLLGTPSQVQMAVGLIQVLLQKAEPC